MDTFYKKIVLTDLRTGKVIDELKPGQAAGVKIQKLPMFKVVNTEFSNNKK